MKHVAIAVVVALCTLAVWAAPVLARGGGGL